MSYATQQEAFWAGQFGQEYTERNQGAAVEAGNVALFSRILARTGMLESVLELGANRGLNLHALRALMPAASLVGVEINPHAADILVAAGFETHRGSLLEYEPKAVYDLTFTKGVLIHIEPASLPRAYDLLVRASKRFVLVVEYYNPTPTEVTYRGHAERLFKRDFAGELMDRHPDLQLLDYGFCYRRDRAFPMDDLTWFLLEKRRR